MKNLSNKIYKWIIENSIIKYLLFVFTIVIFHKQFESISDKTLVSTILNKIESNLTNDIIFITLTILYFLFKVKNRKQKKDKIQLIIINIGFIFIYTYYRFFSNVWCLTSFNFNYNINYSDVLYFIFSSNLINVFSFKSKVNENNGFFENEAITSSVNDLLGFKVYAEQLANQIKVTHHEKAFAIGINGSWGTGKTSFITILKENFNSEDYIIVEFNAWYSNTPNLIIQDFFDTLNEKLKVYNSSITKLLHNYSKKLVGLQENETTKLISNIFSLFADTNSIGYVNKQIEKEISIIDKKIIVIIDDLDRLDNEEIVEVIRLIRNTANFKNVIFIVAYDREYIIKALDNHNSYKSERFLEKIIQLELTLPYFKKDIYSKELAKLIKQKVNIDTIKVDNNKLKSDVIKEFYAEIDSTLLASNITETYYIYKWIENQRDVIRLANSLILNINILIGEIVFADFLRIELIRLKYPTIYVFFFNNLDLFLENRQDNNKNRYQLKRDVNNNNTFVLNNYLNEFQGLTNFEKEKIVALLKGIFFEKAYEILKPSSIIFPSNINSYVAYKLLEGSLSQIEFRNARLSELDVFKNKIKEWVNNNLQFEIKQKFKEIKEFNSREDFENVINVIFYFANLETKLNNSTFNLISFDFEYLFDILINNSQKNILNYFNSTTGEQDYKEYLFSLLNNANFPYEFESELLFYWNKNKYGYYDNEYLITKEELNQLSVKYFKNYSESNVNIDDKYSQLFHRTRTTTKVEVLGQSNVKFEFPDIAIMVFKDKINNNLLNFLNWSILQDSENINRFTIKKSIIEVLFKSFDNYGKYLNDSNINSSPILEEYLKLFELLKNNHFNGYVDFNFNELNPVRFVKE